MAAFESRQAPPVRYVRAPRVRTAVSTDSDGMFSNARAYVPGDLLNLFCDEVALLQRGSIQ